MARLIWQGMALLMVVALCAALLAQTGQRGTAGASAAAAQGPPLDVGKVYALTWPHGSLNGSIMEAPRGDWVKFRHREAKGAEQIYWVNLGTVIYVVEVPPDRG